jgi:hypothetical protein
MNSCAIRRIRPKTHRCAMIYGGLFGASLNAFVMPLLIAIGALLPGPSGQNHGMDAFVRVFNFQFGVSLWGLIPVFPAYAFLTFMIIFAIQKGGTHNHSHWPVAVWGAIFTVVAALLQPLGLVIGTALKGEPVPNTTLIRLIAFQGSYATLTGSLSGWLLSMLVQESSFFAKARARPVKTKEA